MQKTFLGKANFGEFETPLFRAVVVPCEHPMHVDTLVRGNSFGINTS